MIHDRLIHPLLLGEKHMMLLLPKVVMTMTKKEIFLKRRESLKIVGNPKGKSSPNPPFFSFQSPKRFVFRFSSKKTPIHLLVPLRHRPGNLEVLQLYWRYLEIPNVCCCAVDWLQLPKFVGDLVGGTLKYTVENGGCC